MLNEIVIKQFLESFAVLYYGRRRDKEGGSFTQSFWSPGLWLDPQPWFSASGFRSHAGREGRGWRDHITKKAKAFVLVEDKS